MYDLEKEVIQTFQLQVHQQGCENRVDTTGVDLGLTTVERRDWNLSLGREVGKA